jgi:acetylornithine/succinyldiaminopimelate/putrescine aminotransferase
MVAFDLKEERAPELVQAALRRGVLLNNTGPRTVRLVPPLIVTEGEIDEVMDVISAALSEIG